MYLLISQYKTVERIMRLQGCPNWKPAIRESQEYNFHFLIDNLVLDNNIDLPANLIFIDAML